MQVHHLANYPRTICSGNKIILNVTILIISPIFFSLKPTNWVTGQFVIWVWNLDHFSCPVLFAGICGTGVQHSILSGTLIGMIYPSQAEWHDISTECIYPLTWREKHGSYFSFAQVCIGCSLSNHLHKIRWRNSSASDSINIPLSHTIWRWPANKTSGLAPRKIWGAAHSYILWDLLPIAPHFQ